MFWTLLVPLSMNFLAHCEPCIYKALTSLFIASNVSVRRLQRSQINQGKLRTHLFKIDYKHKNKSYLQNL